MTADPSASAGTATDRADTNTANFQQESLCKMQVQTSIRRQDEPPLNTLTISASASEFLDWWHGDTPEDEYIAVCREDAYAFYEKYPFQTESRQNTVSGRAELTQVIESNRDRCNIWVQLVSQSEKPDFNKRGGAGTAATMPGLWLDIDYLEPNRSGNPIAFHNVKEGSILGLPANPLAGYRLLHSGLFIPSALIETGHGLAAYWKGIEPISADDEFLRHWKAYWFYLGTRFGAGVDPAVFDLARVMGSPGTLNHKKCRETGLAPVERAVVDTGPLYDLMELRAALPPLSELEAANRAFLDAHSNVTQGRRRQNKPRSVKLAPSDDVIGAFKNTFTADDVLGWAGCVSVGTNLYYHPGSENRDANISVSTDADGNDRITVWGTSAGAHFKVDVGEKTGRDIFSALRDFMCNGNQMKALAMAREKLGWPEFKPKPKRQEQPPGDLPEWCLNVSRNKA